MRNKDFEKLLKEAIIQEAEEQGSALTPEAEPIPADAQARFDAALNGTQKEPKKTITKATQKYPQPVKRAHRWLAYGLTAVSAVAVVLVVALLIGTGGLFKGMAPEAMPIEQPVMPADQPYEPTEPEPQEPTEPEPEFQPPEPGGAEPEPIEPTEPESPTEPTEPTAGQSWGPEFFLNGEKQDVYTSHYLIKETDAIIPLDAFLQSIGGYYADSPYNAYQVQCYELNGIRYIIDNKYAIFSIEEEYDRLVKVLNAQGKQLTHANLKEADLFPDGDDGLLWKEGNSAGVDYRLLESTLRKSGQNIAIEIDHEAYAIRVMMPETETAAVPDDPERPSLHLFAKEWQGYTCLFPETFEIWKVGDSKLSATENALLQYDTEKLQSAGLLDMDYYLVAESMLNGKDLLTWYLAADGWDDKPEDFDTAESVEIAPGIVSVHYYNRVYDSYICIAKLNTIGTNTLFLAASSITKAGTADFDGIAKEFLAKNGDFAPSETGILNGKYGKSKVFAGDGYQITLTEQFSEQKSEMGFDGYYTAYFGAVMLKIEPFTLKKGWENETVVEYIAGVIKNNKTDAKPEEKDGLVFYRYQRDGMCGWNFAFKGEKAFYLVQFLCREADASELEELFFSIAKTIKVEGSERWNA